MNRVPRDGVLDVVELRGCAPLLALATEWRVLYDRAPSATPFQSPDWLLPWALHFGDGGELRTFVVRRGGTLVGLLPLIERRTENGGRRLELLGTGNTDYVDLLAAAGDRQAAGRAALEQLVSSDAACDACDFQPLRRDAALLTTSAPDGWEAHCSETDVCPALALPGDSSRLDDAVPASFLRKLRYQRRRLEQRGDVRVEEADEEHACDALAEVVALHGSRWAERGSGGVLGDATTRAFHADVARAMAARGMLRLYLLRVGARAVAGFYGFARERCVHYYLGGFDPAFGRYSVGSLVILHAVEEAVRAGAVELDFLRGAESYKYHWGATDRPAHRRWFRRAPDRGAGGARCTEDTQPTSTR